MYWWLLWKNINMYYKFDRKVELVGFGILLIVKDKGE